MRLLILAGTTASGKTAVSIPLAEALQGEIISVDSRQIFRELNIGTAKPTFDERARVVHHFIDEKSVHDRWTAGDFSRESRTRIQDILDRGKTPIVVGGSMLYIRAMLDGFYDGGDESEVDYSSLKAEWNRRGAEEMHAELTAVDPVLAARTHPSDHHRTLRGLSVFRRFGIPLTQLQKEKSIPIELPFKLFFLFGDRRETYDRVNARVLEMMDAGLVNEVRNLFERGITDRECNALATHGYREVFPFLRDEITELQMIADIQTAVRHYVKRQLTWFRRDQRVMWVERSFAESSEQVAKRVIDLFQS